MESFGRKRKANFDPSRRVKVRRRDTQESDAREPQSEDDQHGSPSLLASKSGRDEDDYDEDEQEENGSGSEDGPDAQLSFGARLRQSQKLQKLKSKGSAEEDSPPEWRGGRREEEDGGGGSSSKSNLRSKGDVLAVQGRKTKSAPEEMSSRRPVSRYREVVKPPPNARPKPRDVRFEQELTGEDYHRFRRNYAFLDEYRDKEMSQLREIVVRKKGVTPADREDAKMRLRKMEDEKRAQEHKDREHELLREHKRKEKELVKQGKQPFYLKKSEQKKMLLMDKYAAMSKGQVDKAIEKKRKKVAGKEKKQLPYARRAME